MLRQELLYGADQQHVLSPSPSLFTALKFSHLLTSSTTCGNNFQEAESSQQLGQSPLHSSEGSTSAATPPECSSSPVNFAQQQQQQQQQQASSIWSDFLNGVPFMADETTLTPSSTGGGNTGPSAWWSSSSSSSPSTTTAAGVTSAPPSSREQDLSQQWSNFGSQASQASNSMPEMEASDWQLGCLATAPEVNEQLSKMAIESANVYSSIGTALVDADMTNNPSTWSSILMGSNGADDPTSGLENTSVEGLHEALFSSKFNNSNNGKNVMMKAKDEHSSPSWEFLKSPAANFELEELGMNPKLVQFLGQDARMELDATGWSTMMNEPSTSTTSQQRVSYAASAADAFGRQQQFDPSKIKQEFEPFNGGGSSSSSSPMIPMQPHCDVVGSRPMVDLQHMMNSTGEAASSRWGNKFPAMLSQVLPSSTPSTTKQASLFGSSVGGAGTMIPNRPFGSTNYTTVKQEQHYKVHQREQSSMSQHSSVTSQHSFDSKDLLMEDTNREVSSDQKRGLAATTADHSKATEPFFKRPRIEQQQNPSLPFKVRKEKLGERITALQQLVSPFGKTDTASVLLEAIGYIKCLHEQVQVLSTPYMRNAAATGGGATGAGPTIPSRPSERGSSSSSSSSSTSAATATELGEEQGRQDLRSRGLCLVPISCTMQVANNDNGGDFWAPTFGGASGGAGNNSSGK